MQTRVLVLAEAANPQLTSGALVAWNHFLALREVCDAHLVTEVRNRDAILAAGLPEEAFTTIDNRRPMHLAWWIAKKLTPGRSIAWTIYTALCSLVYPRFEKKVWRKFGEQLQAGQFDVVHRLAPITPVAPSFIASHCAKCEVPFVLGPINGGVPWPKGVDRIRSREREWLSRFRGLHRWLPGYRATRRDAAAIVAASTTAFDDIPECYQEKCVMMPENAINPMRFQMEEERTDGDVQHGNGDTLLHIAYWGRLVPLKGLGILLDAAEALLVSGRATVDLAGSGPEECRLRRWVKERGVEDRVTFHGQLDQETLAKRMAGADVLGFPSLREFGGGTVLEAMALGLLPVVLDHGGPPDLVPDDLGFKIPLGTRDEIASRLRTVFERCADDLDETRRCGKRAAQYVRDHHTWRARAEAGLKIYRWISGDRSRPEWELPTPSAVAVDGGDALTSVPSRPAVGAAATVS